MNFKPILFSSPMVRAIMEDRKTMTRRIIKTKYSNTDICWKEDKYGKRLIERQNDVPEPVVVDHCDGKTTTTHHLIAIRDIPAKYKVGDVLWVRETFCHESTDGENWFFVHKAGNENYPMGSNSWKPSIHMPKAACRIFLEITDIRVERLRDITEADAMAEGIRRVTKDGKLMKYCVYDHRDYSSTPWQDMPTNAVAAFDNLWVQINGQESLEANPWVRVVSFRRIERPDNFLTPKI